MLTEKQRERVMGLRSELKRIGTILDDSQSLQASLLYDYWNPNGFPYKVGDRVVFWDGNIYKVLQDHTSQMEWTPTTAPSLFARVLTADDGTILEWIQPDSTNPYNKGDKVTHNGKTFESLVDNNVWEPGTAGTESLWKEIKD